MKIHRFYINDLNLEHSFWFKQKDQIHQWLKVLRFQVGQRLVLFDGAEHDRLYEIKEIEKDGVLLEMITEEFRKLPEREIYLFWSLLKKDKNEWVLQKATELGVNHFVPMLADRSEKTGFNFERAQKIIIEASEQCGRSNIPSLRQPMHVATAIEQYKDKISLFICEQNTVDSKIDIKSAGVLIGPEGGWSDAEKTLFKEQNLNHLNLHDFTLRAETAAVASVSLLYNGRT